MTHGRLLRLWLSVVDLIAPRVCDICGARLSLDERMICLPCNVMLPRTTDSQSIYDNHTARLFWGRFPVEQCVSFAIYQSHSQFARLIYRMKYGGRADIGEELGRLSAAEFMPSGFFDDIDIIVPMPLHAKRRRERGYNQSCEIASGISQITGLPVDESIVKRIRYTQSQAKQTGVARQHNMENAFGLANPTNAQGKHLLLVDDIVTTGATLTSCALELSKIKDVKISILTIGRTEE